MFVGRKNVVVGELDLAVEVVAAALGAEMDDIVRQVRFLVLMPVLVMMPRAMHTRRCCINEATRKVVVFIAIMKLYVPPDRNEQHRKGHQKGADLKQAFFHAAKLIIFSVSTSANDPKRQPCPTSRAGRFRRFWLGKSPCRSRSFGFRGRKSCLSGSRRALSYQ